MRAKKEARILHEAANAIDEKQHQHVATAAYVVNSSSQFQFRIWNILTQTHLCVTFQHFMIAFMEPKKKSARSTFLRSKVRNSKCGHSHSHR